MQGFNWESRPRSRSTWKSGPSSGRSIPAEEQDKTVAVQWINCDVFTVWFDQLSALWKWSQVRRGLSFNDNPWPMDFMFRRWAVWPSFIENFHTRKLNRWSPTMSHTNSFSSKIQTRSARAPLSSTWSLITLCETGFIQDVPLVACAEVEDIWSLLKS